MCVEMKMIVKNDTIIKKFNVSYHFYADDLQLYNFLQI